MLTFLLTCLFCIAAATGFWAIHRIRPERARGLQAFAQHAGYRYSSRQTFSQELRFLQFGMLTSAATASGRHWLSDDHSLSVFDCTTLGRQGAVETTVILLHCAMPLQGRLRISRRAWFSDDTFTPFHGTALQRLSADDLPPSLAHWWCQSDRGHRMRSWFRPGVIDWLLGHPSMHVEWSDGWLLVAQPGYRILPDEMDTAIKDVIGLASHLQSPPKNPGRKSA